jgi:hypothetical protein
MVSDVLMVTPMVTEAHRPLARVNEAGAK